MIFIGWNKTFIFACSYVIANGLSFLVKARLPVKWMPPESLFHGECSTMSDVLVASFDLFRFGFRTSSYLFPSKPFIIIMPENIFPLHGAMVELSVLHMVYVK